MDESIVKIIDVKVEGTDSINGLVETIKKLREQLDAIDQTSQQYKDLLLALAKNQSKLRTVMKGTAQDMQFAEGSYAAIQKETTALRKAWRATADEVERADLGKKILEGTNKLKEMDKTIGNFQRNVGNYTGSINQAIEDSFGETPQRKIRRLREELAGLTEGTEEYTKKFQELSDATAAQSKMMENLKFTSTDTGQILGTMVGVGQSVASSFAMLNGVMALFGAQSDEVRDAMLKIQGVFAIIQSLSGLENIGDKIEGLAKSFKSLKNGASGVSASMSTSAEQIKNTSAASVQAAANINTASQSMMASAQAKNEDTTATQANTTAVIANNEALQAAVAANSMAIKAVKERIQYLDDEAHKFTAVYETRKNNPEYYKQMADGTKTMGVQLKTFKGIADNANKELAIQRENLKALEANQEKLAKQLMNTSQSAKSAGAGMGQLAQGEKTATTATETLKTSIQGVGKAIATAFAIGIAIAAIVSLVTGIIKLANGSYKAEKATKKLADSQKELEKSMEKTNFQMETQAGYMEAMGRSYQDVIAYKKQLIKAQIEEAVSVLQTSDAWEMYNRKGLGKMKDSEVPKRFKELKEQVEGAKDNINQLLKSSQQLDIDLRTKALETATDATESLKSETQKLREEYERNKKLLESQGLDTTNLNKKYKQDLANLNKQVSVSNKDLGKSIEDLKRQVVDWGKTYKVSLEEIRTRLVKIGVAAKDVNKIIKDIAKERIKGVQQIVDRINEANRSEIDKIKKKYKEESEIVELAYQSEIDMLNQKNAQGLIVQEEYQKQLVEIDRKYGKIRAALLEEEINSGKSAIGKQLMDDANKEVAANQKKAGQEQKVAGYKYDLEVINGDDVKEQVFNLKGVLSEIDGYYDKTMQKIQSVFNSKKATLEQEVEIYRAIANDETASDDVRMQAQQKAVDAEIELENTKTEFLIESSNLRIDKMNEEEEARKQHIEDVKAYASDMTSAMSDLFGSLASYYEADSEAQDENTAEGRKRMEKNFKNQQKMQIAQTTVNTLSGAIGGYMQATQTYPAPYGPILGAAVSAAALIAGFAEIKKIKAQKFDGGGSSSSSSNSFQLPQVEQYEPQYTANITGESDTDKLTNAVSKGFENITVTAVVSETDVTKAQNKQKERVRESTW